MKKILLALLFSLISFPAFAQITVPNTFVTGTAILASEMNANFDALESDSLNRTGGTITGNIVVNAGITVDGIDIGAVLGGTGTPTFTTVTTDDIIINDDITVNTNKFTVEGTNGNTLVGGTFDVTGNFNVNTNKFSVVAASGNTTIAGTLSTGSGAVQLTTTGGKIQAISSTYFDNLSGTNLTGVAMIGSNNDYTARNDFLTYSETKNTSNPSGAAITYDLSLGTHFETALTGNATVTISNVPASNVTSFTVKFTADGSLRTFTWPASVVWPAGVVPAFTSTNNKRDIFTFITYDGGTTWFGFVGGQNF